MNQWNISKKTLIVGFHPGSFPDMKYKRWAPEKYAELGNFLCEKFNASIMIFGSSEEQDISEKILKLMRYPPIITTGKTTLRQAAAIIEKCDLFVSNDTGLMHIAAALNVPTIGIFGPTDPRKNSPRGKNTTFIWKNFPCSPCYNTEKAIKCKEAKCLNSISVEEVLVRIKKILKRKCQL